jgi:DNA-directed RNA polymerase subunit beta'
VHLPLSAEAQAEARILMLSSNNVLSPSSGRPLATPTQDMVLGGYYLTYTEQDLNELEAEKLNPRPQRFQSEEGVELAVESEQVGLQQPIEYRWHGEVILTTPGRVIFNTEVERTILEAFGDDDISEIEFPYVNRTLSKKEMDDFITELAARYGAHLMGSVLDKIKTLGFKYATEAGITISKNDIVIPPDKQAILAEYEERVGRVEQQYERGLITEEERREAVVEKWSAATDEVGEAMQANLHRLNPIFMMANSGARGSFKQIRQLAGMRGLMANPKGEIIERPIQANFMEGLSVLEYFISTHGARKGLADTALRTADSGYLTRRLVDVAQDVIIREEDCKTKDFVELPLHSEGGLNKGLFGRIVSHDLHKPLASGKPGKTVLAEKGALVTLPLLQEIDEGLAVLEDEPKVPVR